MPTKKVTKKPTATSGAKPTDKKAATSSSKKKIANPLFPSTPRNFRLGGDIQVVFY